MNEKPFVTLSSIIAWSCPWYRVRQDELLLPDGSHGQYNVVEAPACAFIVPVTKQGEIVLIHQYRYTVDDWVWEVPAGAAKPDQSLHDAAITEMREEVGGLSSNLHFLGAFNTANGRSNEIAHMFVALDVELGEVAHESAEILTIHPTPIKQALAMARSGQIQDAPSALAILLAEPHYPLT